MTASTIQFITKTRLAELSRQRESLLTQYSTAETQGRGDDLQSLAKLHEGLSKVRITESPLHRDLPNLKALFRGQTAPQSLLNFWREKLLAEIQRGRLRANIVYLFGACLSEWEAADLQGPERMQERQTEQSRVIGDLTAPASSPPLALLSSALLDYTEHRAKVESILAERLEQSLALELRGYDGINWIVSNPHFPKDVRLEAKRFQDNRTLENQLTEAIRVAMRDPRQWSWPQPGIQPRLLWTRNRWRLYPTLNLVELLSVNYVAEFWSSAIDEGYTNSAVILGRRARLQKLIELGAPEVVMSNERRMLALQKDKAALDWYEQVDPWTEQQVLPDDEDIPVSGVVGMRANRQAELRDATRLGYGYDEGINSMVKLVHAEIELLRAAYPESPLHVLKIDIQDYFASVPHATLLTMLQGLGMTDEGLQFTEAFLQIPYGVTPGARATAKRGVPMELNYSHWLSEKLMQVLERYIHSQAKVRIIRQLDDLCILSPSSTELSAAFAAAQAFLTDVGLSLNNAKCGSVAIHGSRADDLPEAQPRWGVLELNEQGQWQIHHSAFQEYLHASRKEVDSRNAILAKVLAYNDQLKHLVWGLGLAMDLGATHRESANQALLAFESQFFGERQSIFQGLTEHIEQRHQVDLQEVPLAWLLWPITAGGLGLRSATVLCGQYQAAYEVRATARKSPPADRPADWQTQSKAWSEFYEDKDVTLEPANCAESKRMNALVEGFIRRGKMISEGKQEGLSQYWRWTLSIFGPSILDRLGTFEFLLTDLVPLQLIQDKLLSSDAPAQ